MSLFSPKKDCPHCGHGVHEPKDLSDYLCPKCDQPGPWASQDQVKAFEDARAAEQRAAAARQAARDRYAQLLGMVGAGALVPSADVAAAISASGYTPLESMKLNAAAFSKAAIAATADDIITPKESAHLRQLMSVLSLRVDELRSENPQIVERIAISGINGGDLPEVTSPSILAKRGEIVHLERAANLMKEVAVRQYQAGYSGFSFPVGKTGIRYRVGGSRGHSVEVGTRLNVADTGTLIVTNKRAVYVGTRKTVEMPYSKLVNLRVYSDGIQFHLSNRVNAPLFKMTSGSELVAAVVNAAAQRAA
jgi:hypothetical protein